MGTVPNDKYASREALNAEVQRQTLDSWSRIGQPTPEDHKAVAEMVDAILPGFITQTPGVPAPFGLSGKQDWETFLLGTDKPIFLLRNCMDRPPIDFTDLTLHESQGRYHAFVGNFPATYKFTGFEMEADTGSQPALAVMNMTRLIAQHCRRDPKVVVAPHLSHCTGTLYDHGGWCPHHADDERGMASQLIASVSFGTAAIFRIFTSPDKRDRSQYFDIPLRDGDLIFFNRWTRHQVLAIPGPRVNLTFRVWEKPYWY
jgi:hypothetical protein